MKWRIPHHPKYDRRSKKWRQNDSCGEKRKGGIYAFALQVFLLFYPNYMGLYPCVGNFWGKYYEEDKGLENLDSWRRFSGLNFLFDQKETPTVGVHFVIIWC